MKNFIQPGGTLPFVAPYAVSSGDMFLVTNMLAVAAGDAANGAAVEGTTEGVFSITKLSTDVVTVWAKLYWDDTNKRLTVTASTHKLAGVATEAAGSGLTVVNCRLNGVSV